MKSIEKCDKFLNDKNYGYMIICNKKQDDHYFIKASLWGYYNSNNTIEASGKTLKECLNKVIKLIELKNIKKDKK
jgi:hypothetical protein